MAEYYQGRLLRRVGGGYSIPQSSAKKQDGDFEVTEEMAAAVQTYLDAIATVQSRGSYTLEVEKTFDLSHVHPALGGTNDALLWRMYADGAVFDYKHGRGHAVEVKDNPQLLYYALGAYYLTDCTELEIVIVQPRAYHPDGPVRSQTVTAQELLYWQNEVLMPAVRATEDPNAPLVAGNWCLFCRAKAICPEQLKVAQQLTRSDLRTIPLPPVEGLSLEDRIRIAQGKDLLETWLDAVWVSLKQEALNGTTVPGFKLVRGRSQRRWKELAADELAKRIPGRELFDKTLKGIPAIEKIIKHDKIEIDISDLIHKPEGKISLAFESDSRPAVASVTALPVYEDDTQTVH